MLLIADPGSTHMGKKEYVEEITRLSAEAGFNVVKWQLFPNTDQFKPNIHMNFDLFDFARARAKKYNIGCTASVFGTAEQEKIAACRDVPFVKFGYSERHSPAIKAFLALGRRVVVTTSIMEHHLLPKGVESLWTYEVNGKVVYPVTTQLNFEQIFTKFDGFSDHTLGLEQAKVAKEYGAKIVEKHITLPYSDIDCPDSTFAIKPDNWGRFVRGLK